MTPKTPENKDAQKVVEDRMPKSEPKEEVLPHLPWYWPIAIFLLVAFAYIVMAIQGIHVNEYTEFWSFAITFVGAGIAVAHHYG